MATKQAAPWPVRFPSPETAARIDRAAGARGMSRGQFLAALVALWDVARARADSGDDALAAELAALGLSTIQSV